MVVSLTLNLSSLGFTALQFDERADWSPINELDGDERVAVACSLAEAFSLFEEVGFVHCNLNPSNLCWNSARSDLQIDDLVSGQFPTRGIRSGVTRHLSEFGPPEVNAEGLSPLFWPGASGSLTLEAERWSIAMLIAHLVLCSAQPRLASSIQMISSTIRAGARSWVDYRTRVGAGRDLEASSVFIDWASIREEAHEVGLMIERGLANEKVGSLLLQAFAAGLDGSRRPSAADWLVALGPEGSTER